MQELPNFNHLTAFNSVPDRNYDVINFISKRLYFKKT